MILGPQGWYKGRRLLTAGAWLAVSHDPSLVDEGRPHTPAPAVRARATQHSARPPSEA